MFCCSTKGVDDDNQGEEKNKGKTIKVAEIKPYQSTNFYLQLEDIRDSPLKQIFEKKARIISYEEFMTPPFKESKQRPTSIERKHYKYQCPICYVYYKRILCCASCRNYICVKCVKDIYLSVKKNINAEKCPFCRVEKENFVIDEVKPFKDISQSPIRLYTDQNANSPVSLNKMTSFSSIDTTVLKISLSSPEKSSSKQQYKIKHKVNKIQESQIAKVKHQSQMKQPKQDEFSPIKYYYTESNAFSIIKLRKMFDDDTEDIVEDEIRITEPSIRYFSNKHGLI